METLLRLLKFLRIIGLFPHKINSRSNNVEHHQEERTEVQQSSDIGSVSPIYLSVTIIYQIIISLLLYSTVLAELIENEMTEAENIIDKIGIISWNFAFFFGMH